MDTPRLLRRDRPLPDLHRSAVYRRPQPVCPAEAHDPRDRRRGEGSVRPVRQFGDAPRPPRASRENDRIASATDDRVRCRRPDRGAGTAGHPDQSWQPAALRHQLPTGYTRLRRADRALVVSVRAVLQQRRRRTSAAPCTIKRRSLRSERDVFESKEWARFRLMTLKRIGREIEHRSASRDPDPSVSASSSEVDRDGACDPDAARESTGVPTLRDSDRGGRGRAAESVTMRS